MHTRITNDDREEEMEQNMQGVGSILGNLKNMATDMGDEIERQNKHLDLIQGKVSLQAHISLSIGKVAFLRTCPLWSLAYHHPASTDIREV